MCICHKYWTLGSLILLAEPQYCTSSGLSDHTCESKALGGSGEFSQEAAATTAIPKKWPLQNMSCGWLRAVASSRWFIFIADMAFIVFSSKRFPSIEATVLSSYHYCYCHHHQKLWAYYMTTAIGVEKKRNFLRRLSRESFSVGSVVTTCSNVLIASHNNTSTWKK